MQQAKNWFSFFSAKLEKILEDRAELENSKTIIGRLLTCMEEEGMLDTSITNKCVCSRHRMHAV